MSKLYEIAQTYNKHREHDRQKILRRLRKELKIEEINAVRENEFKTPPQGKEIKQ